MIVPVNVDLAQQEHFNLKVGSHGIKSLCPKGTSKWMHHFNLMVVSDMAQLVGFLHMSQKIVGSIPTQILSIKKKETNNKSVLRVCSIVSGQKLNQHFICFQSNLKNLKHSFVEQHRCWPWCLGQYLSLNLHY